MNFRKTILHLFVGALLAVPFLLGAQSLFDSSGRDRFRRSRNEIDASRALQNTVKPAINLPVGEIIWVDDSGKYAVVWLNTTASVALPEGSILRTQERPSKPASVRLQGTAAVLAATPQTVMLRVIRHRARQRAVGVRIDSGEVRLGEIITRAAVL
ncbi:MAG: hypothetical protein LBD01_01145 [Puniceicoccales bacterium]|jgi:hypothetical protein|nr:hypothetical protein [Puniceicoccales bacterium]